VLIGIDLCVEWLWGARTKMAAPEYAVNVLTFLFCLIGGVEAGIALGFIASMIAFITGYAAVPTMTTSSVIKLNTPPPPPNLFLNIHILVLDFCVFHSNKEENNKK
jgi:MFS superfamily sulfate permease-like transporter